MAKKTKSMIGHDPLAWLKDDTEEEKIVEEAISTPEPEKKATKKSKSKSQPVETEADNDEKVFEFKSIQDISVVAGLHEQLKKLFSHKKVIMDVSNIERIDTASLQVLYAFIEEVKVNDVEIAWRSPSEAMITSVRLLGMEEVLQLDNVA